MVATGHEGWGELIGPGLLACRVCLLHLTATCCVFNSRHNVQGTANCRLQAMVAAERACFHCSPFV